MKDYHQTEKSNIELRDNLSQTYGFALFCASYKLNELKGQILNKLNLN